MYIIFVSYMLDFYIVRFHLFIHVHLYLFDTLIQHNCYADTMMDYI